MSVPVAEVAAYIDALLQIANFEEDEGGNGLVSEHDLTLWDLSQTVLASAKINNGNSQPVASTQTAGHWLFTSITEAVLAPGSYVVGVGYSFSGDDKARTNTVSQTSAILLATAPFFTAGERVAWR